MSVLLEHPTSLVAYRPNKPTAMVVVADPRVRSTVTRHLWALGVRDVIEASSIAEARPRVANPRDICVADVHLPDGSGLTLLSETRAAGWPNGLALSAADDIGAVRNALAGGVKGYVVTGTRNNLGPPARHGAAQIGAAARMHHHRRPPGAPAHQGGYRELSGREVEVLRLVAEGQSNKAIGVSMGLSALTVKSHLARIARKLGTGDRAGMVAVALRTGIIH
ncbi:MULTISPECIES: response regulator transcription factor [Streptomyces]|uniref:Two component transcriptional regulator, LuxR family n=4 Tax=Streptomyces TaxID=1883 RepID=A0A1I6PTJ2_9ACTN|nr:MULTISPECIES: response regulator transcription factor [Streptomyces]UWM51811.1 response regulator transcription factor [Streptomyces carpaticus]MCK1813018.1 response regulator transcription factor [Streptomyces sp. XM4011]MCU4746491.1 response regulator transcription factor [Streptomyces sp. G-5]QKV71366.1 response regulator transcription factor [Streptomyces harbinensis]QQN76762.1 response regulator transcription factor [Streptomyces sp. XC 2026]